QFLHHCPFVLTQGSSGLEMHDLKDVTIDPSSVIVCVCWLHVCTVVSGMCVCVCVCVFLADGARGGEPYNSLLVKKKTGARKYPLSVCRIYMCVCVRERERERVHTCI